MNKKEYVDYKPYTGILIRTALTALTPALPILAPIAQAYKEIEDKIQLKRVEDLILQIGKRLEKLEKIVLKEDDIQLFELIAEKVRIEHSEKKRRAFANLLFSFWAVGKGDPFDKKLIFLQALDEFSDLHINILKFLDKQNEYIATSKIEKELKIANAYMDLLPALSALAGKFGFILRTWGPANYFLSTENLSPENIGYGCNCKVTSLGREFISFILSPCDSSVSKATRPIKGKNIKKNSRV